MRLSCFTLLAIGSFAIATTAANTVSSRQNLPMEQTEALLPKVRVRRSQDAAAKRADETTEYMYDPPSVSSCSGIEADDT